MKIHRLQRSQIIGERLEQTFRFFANPRNLERLTPAFLRFEFLEPPPPEVRPGTILLYRLRLHGIPVNWRTRIETVETPTRFIDIQEKGPYSLWRHTHTFKSLGEKLTEVEDSVEYALPFGVLGQVARYLFVERDLGQIFAYRADQLSAIFPSKTWVVAGRTTAFRPRN